MLARRVSEAVAVHLSKLVAANDNHQCCRAKNDNAADRLKIVTQGATTVASASDGLCRSLKQTVGATETRYLWCGAAICQQRNASDTAEKRFYSEGEYVHTGTKKYLTLTDHLGSVRDVIDITGTPTLVGSFDYRPSGAVARSWGTVTTGYTYAGLFAQTNTGLLLSTARAYNPANGKWLNVDPIREKGGINLTGYVGGNPISVTDASGLSGLDTHMPGIGHEGGITFGPIPPMIDLYPTDELFQLGLIYIPPGVFIVGMHGNDRDLFKTRKNLPIDELAAMIVTHPAWRPGMTVYMLTCQTGQPGGPAEQLAKILGAEVIGPDKFFVRAPGEMVVVGDRPYTWEEFWADLYRRALRRLGYEPGYRSPHFMVPEDPGLWIPH